MKKKLSLLVIALMLGGSVSVFAAVSDMLSAINYSANFGLVTGSSSWAEASASSTDTDSNKLGFHALGQASYDINDFFAANLGMGYKALNSAQTEGSTDTLHSSNYIYVPATVSYKIPYEWANLNFSVNAGGYGSYLINAESKTGDNDAVDAKDSLSSADVGATFGASITAQSPISQLQAITFAAAYDHGLRDIATDVKNQNFSFSLSTQF
ncbi:hypothetical protein CL658_04890 [bacterium]|nr:hypothetical protein [bacterium]